MPPLSLPPMAYSRPFTTAAPNANFVAGIGALVLHVPMLPKGIGSVTPSVYVPLAVKAWFWPRTTAGVDGLTAREVKALKLAVTVALVSSANAHTAAVPHAAAPFVPAEYVVKRLPDAAVACSVTTEPRT